MLEKEKVDAMFGETKPKYENLKKLAGIDGVDHPSHYNAGNIEVIDFIEDQGLISGFCLGNAIKYICRAGKKNSESEIKDLSKAEWYLKRYIQYLQDKNE